MQLNKEDVINVMSSLDYLNVEASRNYHDQIREKRRKIKGVK